MRHFTTLGNAAYKFFKTSVLIPRGQSVSAVTGGLNIFAKVGQHTCTIWFPERLCAVYLRENIQPLLSRPTHFAHAGLARNVLKNL